MAERAGSVRRPSTLPSAPCTKFEPNLFRRSVCKTCSRTQAEHNGAAPGSDAEEAVNPQPICVLWSAGHPRGLPDEDRIKQLGAVQCLRADVQKYQKRWFVLDEKTLKYYETEVRNCAFCTHFPVAVIAIKLAGQEEMPGGNQPRRSSEG